MTKLIVGVNDLATVHPELIEEWDYSKNEGLTPEDVTSGSGKKVWWKCKEGHSWQAKIDSRTRGVGCPYCAGLIAIKGKNDLQTMYPKIAKQWDYSKNGTLKPDQLKAHSNKKVWWKCERGHSWKASVDVRTKGIGCPYCSNQKVLIGYNDLATTHPDLCREWDYQKNKSLTPEMVVAGSNKRVWWKCSKGHSWIASINQRVNGTGCPYCSGRLAIKGETDLQTTHPDLCKEWDYEKNKDITPEMVVAGSSKRVWWKCTKNHVWEARIADRTSSNAGCPYCSNQKVLKGYNDFLSIYPDLAQEWDYEKNRVLKPEMVTPGSNRKVWWKCLRCGHSWKATVCNRTHGTGCPNCTTNSTSFAEQAVYYYIKKCFPDARNRDLTNDFEIDIYIPSIKTGIEYDGLYYHGKAQKMINDNMKDEMCHQRGIRLIRIREKGLQSTKIATNVTRTNNNSNKDLSDCILRVLEELNVEKTIRPNVDKDVFEIHSQYTESYKQNSLAKKFPNLAREWDYEKNKNLTPEQVTQVSGKTVWWKCDKGHSWQAKISSRVNGNGCPYCSNYKVLKGYNDLATTHPNLCKEWDYGKNKEILPEQVTSGSNKRVWWKCDKGHSWRASVHNRTTGNGCPYCSSRKLLKGYNDLATTHPSLCKEWDYKKNKNLTPYEVMAGSSKKVWWKCDKGHSWEATISSRSNGHGCPICAKKIISGKSARRNLIIGKTDLASKYPEVARDWDYELNDLKPEELSYGSGKRVHWACSKCGHKWVTSVSNRTNRHSKCPRCHGQGLE